MHGSCASFELRTTIPFCRTNCEPTQIRRAQKSSSTNVLLNLFQKRPTRKVQSPDLGVCILCKKKPSYVLCFSLEAFSDHADAFDFLRFPYIFRICVARLRQHNSRLQVSEFSELYAIENRNRTTHMKSILLINEAVLVKLNDSRMMVKWFLVQTDGFVEL